MARRGAEIAEKCILIIRLCVLCSSACHLF